MTERDEVLELLEAGRVNPVDRELARALVSVPDASLTVAQVRWLRALAARGGERFQAVAVAPMPVAGCPECRGPAAGVLVAVPALPACADAEL